MKGDITILENSDAPAGSMLALVTGSIVRDTKKPSGPTDGKRYGHVTLDKSRREGVRYGYLCDCGELSYPTLKERQAAERMDTGCLREDCPYTPPEVKAWGNAKYALRLQLVVLLRYVPQQVDPFWGGMAYGTRNVIPVDEGLHHLMEDLTLKVRGNYQRLD